MTARRLESLQQLAEQIKKEVGDGVKVHPVRLDVSKPEEISAFVGNLPADFKEIDVLVNNAYASPPPPESRTHPTNPGPLRPAAWSSASTRRPTSTRQT